MPPALGRVAQAEDLGDLSRQAAAFEVVDRARRAFQCLLVVARGLVQHVVQRGLLLALLRGALAVLRGRAVVGHLQAHLRGQVLHGLHEAHARVLHEEADRIAVRAATEAVAELLARAHRERRGLFVVEGTAGDVVLPRLAQRHVPFDDIDDVHPAEQLLFEIVRDQAPLPPQQMPAAVREKPARARCNRNEPLAALRSRGL